MKIKFTLNLLFCTSVTLWIVASCNPSTPIKKLVYSETEDFVLIDDVSRGLGYDTILIAKGSYPITFDKNKNGQLTLKVLKTMGKGDELRTYQIGTRGRRKGDFNCNGLHCICWGFSCKGDSGPRIMYNFTLTNENLLIIDILEKVPFGDNGYKLEQ